MVPWFRVDNECQWFPLAFGDSSLGEDELLLLLLHGPTKYNQKDQNKEI